jgi:hypothetical protein
MTEETIHTLILMWVYAGVGAAVFSLVLLFAVMYYTNKEKNNDREGN